MEKKANSETPPKELQNFRRSDDRTYNLERRRRCLPIRHCYQRQQYERRRNSRDDILDHGFGANFLKFVTEMSEAIWFQVDDQSYFLRSNEILLVVQFRLPYFTNRKGQKTTGENTHNINKPSRLNLFACCLLFLRILRAQCPLPLIFTLLLFLRRKMIGD